MTIFIYLCILALNAAAIFIIYKFLGAETEKRSKLIFIVVGLAIMYVTVSAVYWLSTKNIDLGELAETGKNFIIFSFVPVNGIIVLPVLARSYKSMKDGKLKFEPFRNRCILLGAILLIILVIEFFYFKDIQAGILSLVQKN